MDIENYVSVKEVVVKGIAYNTGCFVITAFENDEPKMSKITHLLMKRENVVIVGKDYRAQLNSHFRGYELVEMQVQRVYSLGDLIDPLPLDAYRLHGKLICVWKYHVINKSF